MKNADTQTQVSAVSKPDPYGRLEEFRDFRNFLWHVWTSLGLPEPTPIQYDIADFLQNGPERVVIQGFRGVGKSWMTGAFGVWNWYWEPDTRVLDVSASKRYADDLSTFMLQIIRTVPGMAFLDCVGKDRHSKVAFDVGPAGPHKQASCTSLGITGQLAGSRANLIIPDDIETLSNALTEGGRAKLAELIKEFDAILLPGGRIVYLGTPQTEQTIYNLLAERGYTIRKWPSEYPDESWMRVHGHTLSPMLREKLEANPALAGHSTEPTRFPEEELEKRRLSYGRSGYALQFMLDTSLSDANRYPLKLRDLMVYPCKADQLPDRLEYSPLMEKRLAIPGVGIGTDGFYEPLVGAQTSFSPYTGSAMFIDPAGTGSDETAYAIGRLSHGRIAVPEATGIAGGYGDATMIALAEAAKRWKVNQILVESNFGDGMFAKLLQPHLQRIYPCSVEDIRVHTQKELRIIDTLEPVMNQHRLIVDPSVIEGDAHRDGVLPGETAAKYRLFYQLTRITRERACLAHDDRLDALAGLVAYWLESMAKDVSASVSARSLAEFERELMDETDGLWEVVRPRNGTGLINNRGLQGRGGYK